MRYYVGIDAGSTSVNCVAIDENRTLVFEAPYKRHFGKVEESAYRLLLDTYEELGRENIAAVAFTGSHGAKLSQRLGAFFEFETICQVLGALQVCPEAKTVISMGGQDTALFQISHEAGDWEIEYFNTNGPCASGTGSFIDQQAQRLATSMYSRSADPASSDIDRILKDFIALGLTSQNPANVACRCTVFTKSDMIHLQNKGERLEDIIYGLHLGNARNYISTIVGNRTLKEPILFIGGLSLNALQVKAFRSYFPNLTVPPYSTSIGALGVALHALDSGRTCEIEPSLLKGSPSEEKDFPRAEPLIMEKTCFAESGLTALVAPGKRIKAYLGIDIGSTTTKYALIDQEKRIIDKDYVPTQGKPIEVTQRLLDSMRRKMGKGVEIAAVATTGSGRNVVGDFLNADLIIDEITAHARGAVEIDPEVDTVFEIGGQDSKYISIVNGNPLDFDMNKVCAAGTGSFLHELANKYGINIVGEFQDVAISSKAPVKLAERCTVFMESDLVSYHQKGAEQTDLMAGLCYAVVHNYLNRVVEKRKVGKRVMFLGGPSLNKAVVAAFERVLNRGLIVPPNREVLGAYGAALSAMEKTAAEGNPPSKARSLESAIADRMRFEERVCRADPQCHNQCKLKIYDFDGRRSVWGGECGRYEARQGKEQRKENYFQRRDDIWRRHIEGVYVEAGETQVLEDAGRPTIGMQRALYGHQNSIFFAHFFDKLGLRLVLSPSTNAKIAKKGIEATRAETCFPIKVSHGHVQGLVGKTRYLFLPAIINMPTPTKGEAGFYCPLVQGNSYMLKTALDLDPSTILQPVIHMKLDPDSLALELYEQLGPGLGIGRRAVREAVRLALERQDAFVRELQEEGRKVLATHEPSEPLVIVTGRPYNLYDERLNLRLGQNLAKIGVKAIPMDFVDVSDVDLSDFPSMYWGLGAKILRVARFVGTDARYFGLHLTNFSCGADSFLEHFYRHVMGEKPYLILELDEHSAVAGVMTRLEAFRNVIVNTLRDSLAKEDSALKLAN
jgi:predicted CoA-substrate-specific enzyme activase